MKLTGKTLNRSAIICGVLSLTLLVITRVPAKVEKALGPTDAFAAQAGGTTSLTPTMIKAALQAAQISIEPGSTWTLLDDHNRAQTFRLTSLNVETVGDNFDISGRATPVKAH
jgi:hypothetical protein